ncbi:MAG: biotin/lipoyl-binding protein, partial [Candidatus Krumholzibacteria bacterium]|nr:biotin/lipoyl-binding protein [Candidatus Krumholzibacteria bacterium]
MSAKITGKISEILIDEGMEVESGQVLARLDAIDAMAALRMAEAELGVARAGIAELDVKLANDRRTLERNSELHRRGLVSQEDLDQAETQVASLEAKLELAKKQVTAADRNV